MYEQLSAFAQSWGFLLIAVLFAGVLIYALWPGNGDKFRAAAAKPLEDGPPSAAERASSPSSPDREASS